MNPSPPDLPSIAGVAAALGPLAARFDVDVVDECDSTNTRLLTRAEAGAPPGTVLVARHQSAGRGRRGRTWHSAPGDSLTFSLLWRFPASCPMGGLSLAAGVAAARALEAAGVAGLRLKWPNDLLLDGRKLGGILVELVPNSRWTAVVGIGLNRRLPEAMPPEVAGLAAALGPAPAADGLLAGLLAHLLETFEAFSQAGFPAVRDAWLARNAHAGAMVRVLSDFEPPLDGRFVDVDDEGALRIAAGGRTRRLISGELSLRPVPGDGA